MEDTQHIASARGNNIGISRKFAVEVAGFLRGKNLADAKKKMEDVIALKVAVPFKRYHMDLGHKRGPMGPGRFPAKVAKEVLLLLKSAEMNAQNKGLDIDSLYVSHIVANKGNTQMKAGRQRGRHAKRTHIEIVLKEKEKKKKGEKNQMIERKFVSEKMREYLVNEYLYKELGPGKYSSFEIKRTPLGERIIIYTARPGLIVGKGGENIRDLTKVFKTKFKMENPQIEVAEISNPNIDAQTMAEQIVTTLERFGPKRFKSVGYKTLQRIIDAGAMGAEIAIGGRGLPGARAKTWKSS